MSLIGGLRKRFLALFDAGKERILDPGARLLEIEGFRPVGFACGIEILNDSVTPMDFVVHVIERNLGLKRQEATMAMLRIHTTGGVLIALPSEAAAMEAAAAIVAEARAKSFPLICRVAISAPGEAQEP